LVRDRLNLFCKKIKKLLLEIGLIGFSCLSKLQLFTLKNNIHASAALI
jgi:hypothetical protein